ncbi:hypothetical protein [Deefgea salmonis]|uniref:Uncharacterized protein n=1 Tax=Deefgea salmonis TaxID=2875502 RepID=A0ABS8BIY8_9NEIS|nr:hypothetical protein [Deefgea salmonis]MCB5195685.1 hypothetical protein [Deefgea salmonis]
MNTISVANVIKYLKENKYECIDFNDRNQLIFEFVRRSSDYISAYASYQLLPDAARGFNYGTPCVENVSPHGELDAKYAEFYEHDIRKPVTEWNKVEVLDGTVQQVERETDLVSRYFGHVILKKYGLLFMIDPTLSLVRQPFYRKLKSNMGKVERDAIENSNRIFGERLGGGLDEDRGFEFISKEHIHMSSSEFCFVFDVKVPINQQLASAENYFKYFERKLLDKLNSQDESAKRISYLSRQRYRNNRMYDFDLMLRYYDLVSIFRDHSRPVEAVAKFLEQHTGNSALHLALGEPEELPDIKNIYKITLEYMDVTSTGKFNELKFVPLKVAPPTKSATKS